MSKAPVLFVGHGNPMNTLEVNGYTTAWANLGVKLAKPRAILVISAHWYFAATAITAMHSPRTIHDFYGFPEALFEFEYPAPGDPDLAKEIVEAVKPHWVGLDRDQWGLDHGTWSVLAHMYPKADVPVLQLSNNALKPLSYHLELAERLAPLRQRGVMIVASGNVVHNLRLLRWKEADLAFDWARRFDDVVTEQMTTAPGDILRVCDHRDHEIAVPTPDHFIPLLYLAGIAASENLQAESLLRGYTMGAISMTCYGLETGMALQAPSDHGSSLPEGVPPDQTNL